MARKRATAKVDPVATPQRAMELPLAPAPEAVAPPVATPESEPAAASAPAAAEPASTLVQIATRWQDDGWTAQVIKNEEDDGWAVSMTMDGESEPSLIGPWTMGRDKKNPKPLDSNAFATLVKVASEVIRRHEQQAHAALHKSVKVMGKAGRVRVNLDIVPDEDAPYAILSAFDDIGTELAQVQVAANFKFNYDSAAAWIQSGYARPAGGSRDD